MASVNGTSALQRYEGLFLLDFLSKYPQSQCGASASIDVGLLSAACILPFPVWVAMLFLAWYSNEFYFAFTQFVLTAMTVVHVAMQYFFERSPPIAGCGPSRSWPCPQVTLVACGMGCMLRYSKDVAKQPDWKILLGMSVVAFTMHAVMYLGFADASAVVAGTVVGSTFAYIEHETVIIGRRHPKFVRRIKLLMNFCARKKLQDSVMEIPLLVDLVTGPAQGVVPEKHPDELPQPVCTKDLPYGRPIDVHCVLD